jgi:hypothetical protein
MRTITKVSSWAGLLLAGGISLCSSQAQAHFPKDLTLFGGLTTHQVACSSLCTEGPLTGGLPGTLDFTMASMTATETPNVVTYVGTNTITTEHGTLAGTDYGIWNLSTGEFVDYTTFSSGTGRYAGATGSFTITGTFDPTSGTGSSHYIAALHLH